MSTIATTPCNGRAGQDIRQKVLIIDDDTDWTGLLKAHFSDKYRVEIANRAGDALEMVRQDQPDVIILDLVMPSMDGFGLIHRINQIKSGRVCVILLTGWKTQEVEECAAGIGCAAVLGKPISLAELEAAIESLVGEATEASTSAAAPAEAAASAGSL